MIPKRSLMKLASALDGLAIVGVLPGTAAAHAGIRYGDVLLEVNGERVRTFGDYVRAKDLRAGSLELRVFRSGEEREVTLQYEVRTEPPDFARLVTALAAARVGGMPDAEDEEDPSS